MTGSQFTGQLKPTNMEINMNDTQFFGAIIALALVFTGHPVLAILLYILVA